MRSFRSLMVVAVLLLPQISSAQDTQGNLKDYYPKRVISRIEVSVGPNLIYIHGMKYLKDARVGKLGFRTSLGLVHTFNEKLDLDLMLSYETKGYKFKLLSESEGPPPTDKLITDVTLNYATATILPRYSVLPMRKLSVGLGPYFGYLIDGKLLQKSYYRDELVNKYRYRPDPDITYNRFDFGLALLVGSNFVLKDRLGLTAQFTYSRGLSDVNKPVVDRIRNSTYSFLVGISIDRKSYP